VSATAAGRLDRIDLGIVATQGIAGHGEAVLTPFAAAPFASARLQLERIDPASWRAGAPQAQLSLVADIAPQADGIIGSFGLTNHQPGPLDRQRLPLATLAGTLSWQGAQATLHTCTPPCPAAANWPATAAGATTAPARPAGQPPRCPATAVLPARHPPGRPLSATLAGDRQDVRIDLRDATFSLLAEASLAGQRLRLPKLQLAAGTARLLAQGELDLNGPREFTAEGELQHFDPSRFGRLPPAHINARLKASGHLAPQPVVDASFALHDSRVSGQAVSGQGQLAIAWPRIPRADIELAAGNNRLTAHGAYGQAGDLLKLDLDAPQLAPFGLDGGVQGHWELGGTPQARAWPARCRQPGSAGPATAGCKAWP
jgi:translocation and assembly module TamB